MNLYAELEKLRKEAGLPALGAIAVVQGKPTEAMVVGTRRIHGEEKALTTDAFHIGSNTKAMTAALIGLAWERQELSETTTLGEIFSGSPASFAPEWSTIDIQSLLAHRAGLTQGEPTGTSLAYLHAFSGPTLEQRERWMKERLAALPDPTLGSYSYSNAGYVLLGVVLERLWRKPWEVLLKERLWQPLGVHGGGFGAPPQLWQHRRENEVVVPVPFERKLDNPPVMAPAGGVHLPLEAWARCATLWTSEGLGVLKPETLSRLLTPLPKSSYAGGWVVENRAWAGGIALTHAGSNLMNRSVAWVAPQKQFAALVATNVEGEGVDVACDKAVQLLINHYLLKG